MATTNSPNSPNSLNSPTSNPTHEETLSNDISFEAQAFTKFSDITKFISSSFSGESDTLQEFIDQCSLANNICRIEWRSSLLLYIISRISGNARIDIRDQNFDTWKELRTFLEERFQDSKTIDQLMNEFTSIRQNREETVTQFYRRIEKLRMKIIEVSRLSGEKKQYLEEIALNRFKNKCLPNISRALATSQFSSGSEALAVAVNVEKFEKSLTPTSSKYCKFCKLNNHNSSECRKKTNHFCTYCRTNTHNTIDCRIMKQKKNDFSQVKINQVISCRYCKKNGHKVEECRKLKWKKEQEAKAKEETTNNNTNTKFETQRILNVDSTSYIIVKSENSKKGYLTLIVDTGAQMSILKKDVLKDIEIFDDEKIEISGIIPTEKYPSKGYSHILLNLTKFKYKFRFHIFDPELLSLDVDGIIGYNIFNDAQCLIDFNQRELIFKKYDDFIPFSEKTTVLLPPKTIIPVSINVASTENTLLKLKDITHTIRSLKILCKPQNKKVQILLSNPSEEEQKFSFLPQIEPATKLQLYRPILLAFTDSRKQELLANIRTNHLQPEEKVLLKKLILHYNDVFHVGSEPFPIEMKFEHEIQTMPNTKPISVKNYRFPECHKNEVEKQTTKMLKDGIIRNSASPWNAPIWIVPKKLDQSGIKKWRIVVDYRKLNEMTISDCYPIPNIEEILDQLGHSIYFSTLDLASGFHQIRVKQEDIPKTAFSTHDGHYEYLKMPFGLKNAPSTFQRIMNQTLYGLIGKICFVYLDDIIIFSDSLENHLLRLEKVFLRLRENHLRIQLDKSEFLKKETKYLGHIITDKGVKPNPELIKAIKNFPKPSTVNEIQRFLGLTGYYRRFIKDYASLSKPLTSLLKKGQPFEWTIERNEAFQKLIELLQSNLILIYPDFKKQFFLTTDASNYAIGSILSQKNEEEFLRPISYASRTLNKAELNYSTIEKELLAIVWSTKHFRPYLYGRKFIIITDHKPLLWLFNVKDPGSRLLRWRLRLEEYDYEITYKKGSLNVNADALSRIQINIISTSWKTYEKFCNYNQNQLTNQQHLITHKLFKDVKNLAVFTSTKPTLKDFNIITKIQKPIFLTIEQITKDRCYYICYIRKNNNRFEYKNFLYLLETLLALITKNGQPEITFFDDKYATTSHTYEKALRMIRYIFKDTKIETSVLVKLKYPENVPQLLQNYHDNILIGHPGFKRMFMHIKEYYFWPSIREDIKNYVKTCPECQLNKINRHPTKMPLQLTDIANRPFGKIALDTIIMPKSQSGNTCIISIQDNLSKFIQLYPEKKHDAETIKKILINFIGTFGVPETILTDNGMEFVSNTITEITLLFKISHIRTTPYHPEGNGGLERCHAVIKDYFKIYTEKNISTWENYVATAIHSYNIAIHSTTGYSPYELVFGRKPYIPSLNDAIIDEYYYSDYYTDLRNKLQHAHLEAQQKIQKAHEKTKTRFDQDTHPTTYRIGEKALLKNIGKRTLSKLTPTYKGPYKITKVNPPNVTLQIGNSEKTFHANLLRPFFAIPLLLQIFFILTLLLPVFGNTLYHFEELQTQNGIFLSKLGEAKVIIDKYSILTYFDTTQILSQIRQLRNFDSQVTLLNQEPSKFLMIINNLEEDLQTINDIADTHVNRRKRGLFNAIGYVSKFLWGTPDADDDIFYRNNIEKLKNDDSTVQLLLKRQIQLINNTVNNFEHNQLIFQENEKKINTQLREFETFMELTEKARIKDEKEIHINSLQNTETILLEQIEKEISTLREALLHAKANILHPAVLTPRKFLLTLEKLKFTNKQFPFTLDIKNIAKYFTIGKLHTESIENTIIFLCELPLVEYDVYDTYELTPFPFAYHYPSKIHFVFIPQFSYILLSRAKTRFTTIQDIQKCQHKDNVYLCQALTHPIIQPPCEVQMILYSHMPKCNLSAIPAFDEVWHQIDTNSYIFTINYDTQMALSKNEVTEKINLPHRGILQLQPDVLAISRAEILHATHENPPTILHHKFQPFNPPQPIEDYSNFKFHQSKFQPISLKSINTKDFQLLAKDLEDQYHDINTQFTPFIFLSTISVWTCILYLILIILLFIFLYKLLQYFFPCLPDICTLFCHCKKSQPPPSLRYSSQLSLPSVHPNSPPQLENPITSSILSNSSPKTQHQSNSSPKTHKRHRYPTRSLFSS